MYVHRLDQLPSGKVMHYMGATAAGAVLYAVSWGGDHQDWLEEANRSGDVTDRMKQNAYAAGLGTVGIEGVRDGAQYLSGGDVPDIFYDDWITFAGVTTGFTATRELHRRVHALYNLEEDELLEE